MLLVQKAGPRMRSHLPFRRLPAAASRLRPNDLRGPGLSKIQTVAALPARLGALYIQPAVRFDCSSGPAPEGIVGPILI
jgi:hypothetical protein